MSFWNHTDLVLNPRFAHLEAFVRSLPARFAREEGQLIHDGRNKLRVVTYEGVDYVVKRYRRPNFVNRYVYGVLRPSKALRAYRNALRYEAIGVGTPSPVAYYTLRRGLAFDDSYFVTLLSTCPHRYEDLFTESIPYADEVLSEIGRVTARLHEHGLAHKDYGRANILFEQRPDGSVRLDIVDLNRMDVGPINMEKGCKNFERLPATAHMHRVMAEAYAKARGYDAEACYRLMRHFRSTQPGQVEGEF